MKKITKLQLLLAMMLGGQSVVYGMDDSTGKLPARPSTVGVCLRESSDEEENKYDTERVLPAGGGSKPKDQAGKRFLPRFPEFQSCTIKKARVKSQTKLKDPLLSASTGCLTASLLVLSATVAAKYYFLPRSRSLDQLWALRNKYAMVASALGAAVSVGVKVKNWYDNKCRIQLQEAENKKWSNVGRELPVYEEAEIPVMGQQNLQLPRRSCNDREYRIAQGREFQMLTCIPAAFAVSANPGDDQGSIIGLDEELPGSSFREVDSIYHSSEVNTENVTERAHQFNDDMQIGYVRKTIRLN